LAYEVGEYDLPASLFQRLGAELGPSLAPEVEAALPPAWLGLPAETTLTGIIDAGGGQWMLAVIAPSQTSSRASIDVLRWSGRRWAVEDRVGPEPDFTSLLLFPQYSVVRLAGSPLPALEVGGEYPTWSATIGYVGGVGWRIVEMSGR